MTVLTKTSSEPTSTPERHFVIDKLVEVGWAYIPGRELDRSADDPFLPRSVAAAVARISPGVDPASVVGHVRLALGKAQHASLIDDNKQLAGWMREGVPVGGGRRVPLLDFLTPAGNELIVADDVVFESPNTGRTVELDLVLFINGLPVVVAETKDDDGIPWVEVEGSAESWAEAAETIARHEKHGPEFFATNIISFAVGRAQGEMGGEEFRYGAIRRSSESWELWGSTADPYDLSGRARVERSIELLLTVERLLSIVEDYTLYGVDRFDNPLKITPRYPQVEAVEAIHRRALEPGGKQGLIVQHQGTGKTLAMVFAARKLAGDPELNSPTVFVLADRTDLVDQTHRQFEEVGMVHVAKPTTSHELREIVKSPHQRTVVTTIHKFGGLNAVNDSSDIIVLIDEAHRTQEGSLGTDLRKALPNARFFGFTGTPVVGPERNTFKLFGDPTDPGWVLNEYLQERSLADGTVVRIHVDSRAVQYHLDEDKITAEYERLLAQQEPGIELRDNELRSVVQAAIFNSPERLAGVCEEIVSHYYTHIEPNGLKAQIVAYNRAACVAYDKEIQRILAERGKPDETAVVMSYQPEADRGKGWEKYRLSDRQVNEVVKRFNSPSDALKFLIVTSKLCTGFDAPIEGALYLDKPMEKHTLFQTMSRVNRKWRNPYTGWRKRAGIVVDFVGLGEAITKAFAPLNPDGSIADAAGTVEDAFEEIVHLIFSALAYFDSIDPTPGDEESVHEGAALVADSPEQLHAFVNHVGKASDLWEALYPDERLEPHAAIFGWMVEVYREVVPKDDANREMLRRLGAKTLQLVGENIKAAWVERVNPDPFVLSAAAIAKLRQHGIMAAEAEVGETTVGEPITLDKAAQEVFERAVASQLEGDDASPFRKIGDHVREIYEQYLAHSMDSAKALEEVLGAAEKVAKEEKSLAAFERDRRQRLPRMLSMLRTITDSLDEKAEDRLAAEAEGMVEYYTMQGNLNVAEVNATVKEILTGAFGIDSGNDVATQMLTDYVVRSCRAVAAAGRAEAAAKA